MAKKNLSQNFLVDNNIKKKMLEHINICKKDVIVEIGSGEGAISKDIYKLAKIAFFIEIDKNLIINLKENIELSDKIKIYNDDILKFNLKDLIKKYKNIRIIGNIP
ncbi:MAG TPA: rRNA adenine N-6-methyltransferase family protein, partial [Candidatus Azoamicus sp.]